jgi:pre-mRNA-processing factor 6
VCCGLVVQEPERARIILAKARGEGEARVPASSTQRVWMKSAVVERELGNVAEERRLLKAALERFPYFDKLWLMLGQLEQRQGAIVAARLAYQNGLKRCISSVPLWRVRRCCRCFLFCLTPWTGSCLPGFVQD